MTVIVRQEERLVIIRRNVTLDDGVGAVTSVAGRTGAVVLTKADVGLPLVDNTADASKPVSALQAAADAAVLASAIARANHTGTQSADTLTDGTTNKAFLATERTKLAGVATGATANSSDATLLARASHTGEQATSTITGLDASLALKAPLASPTFTGVPAGPTAAPGTSTTQFSTTAFVQAAVALAVTGTLEFKSSLDASANPNYPAAEKGDLYLVNVAGKVGGASGVTVAVGDAVIAKADNAGGTEASVGTSWFVLEKNLVGALLAANNLSDLADAATARGNLGLGSLATQSGTFSGTSSGTNTGDQTSIVGITGTLAEFNAALTGADFATGGGTVSGASSGTNTGDQDVSGLMVKASNLSDLANKATARTNLGTLFGTRVTKTGTYTVLAADVGVCFNATSGTWTLALTAAATLGDGFACAVFNSGSGVITIDPDGSETIRDATSSATTKTLAQGEGGIIVCDGSGFLFLKVAAGGGIGGSAGSVDNALLRADGTGGLTAQGSVLFVGDETVYSSQYYVRVSAGGAQTNNHLILEPKGSGALLRVAPDGNAAGGNNRGTYSIDWQFLRSGGTQVASGAYAVILGGSYNTASGINAVAGGYGCSATSSYDFAAGENLTASGGGSTAFGGYGATSGQNSFGHGRSYAANKYGQYVHGSGSFAAGGDAQFSRLVLRNSTSSTTPTNLFLEGSSLRLTIPNNTTWLFSIYIVGRTATGTLNSYGYKVEGVVEKGTTAGSVAIVGTITKTVLAEDSAAADVDVTADTTNGALNLLVTAPDTTAMRWVATVHLTEVAYA